MWGVGSSNALPRCTNSQLTGNRNRATHPPQCKATQAQMSNWKRPHIIRYFLLTLRLNSLSITNAPTALRDQPSDFIKKSLGKRLHDICNMALANSDVFFYFGKESGSFLIDTPHTFKQ